MYILEIRAVQYIILKFVLSFCHIDLNSFEIDLNGYDIVFRYHYDGLYSVYGGLITDYSVYDMEGNLLAEAEATYMKLSASQITDEQYHDDINIYVEDNVTEI